MRYCDYCKQYRPEAKTGHCPECGAELVDRPYLADPGAVPPSPHPPTAQPQTQPQPKAVAGQARSADERRAQAPASGPSPGAEAKGSPNPYDIEIEGLIKDYTNPPRSSPAGKSSTGKPSDGTATAGFASRESPSTAQPSSSGGYEKIVQRVTKHVKDGYNLYGFVGHVNSGKTHCHKALDILLRSHGVGCEKAQIELDVAHVPGNSKAEVFDFVYTGKDARWIFVDAGGEIYASLQENDWTTLEHSKTELTHWLHRCQGLFMFLHLNRAHFDKRLMNKHSSFKGDKTMDEARDRARRALAAQRELTFFRNFLLLLRALKAKKGAVNEVFSQCRQHGGALEDALRDYMSDTPLLDIPVMFFFTKADIYGKGFEISDGVHLTPRQTPMGPMIFAARYLPLLFEGLLQHVRRFKFDFLQSHVEYPIMENGRPVIDEEGNPVSSVHWESDPMTPLSVGLFPGLEFILRNQARSRGVRRLWTGPGIDTRLAMLIHRKRNPELWKDVKVDLGTWSRAWRSLL